MKPYQLTKSKMLSFRQCPKKLHLEINRPELIEEDKSLQRVYDAGNQVGEKARELYGVGVIIDIKSGVAAAVEKTKQLLASGGDRPIYEAAFIHEGVLVLADVVVPGKAGLRVIEVKSSTSVKDINLFDCAVQTWVMRAAGYKVHSIVVAHINSEFVYKGDGDYSGLLTEVDVAGEVKGIISLVPALVAAAKTTLADNEPETEMGPHCTAPYDCAFQNHCSGPSTDYPVSTLPRIGAKRWALEKEGFKDIREIPADRLSNPNQLRVWQAVKTGQVQFDSKATDAIQRLPYPRFYLDFETIQFAVPIWAETRPYEQLPFQWACKIEPSAECTEPTHAEFLDLTGEPPMRACAEQLIATLGTHGPIIVYSGFEARVIKELAARFKDLSLPLKALLPRLTDLLPIVREYYYDPRMSGSWSIKKVLPTIAPDLDYKLLEGVQDGGDAQRVYLEAICQKDTKAKKTLKEQLLVYCAQDVSAMIRVSRYLAQLSS